MNNDLILSAFQTGWLSVEAFGLLRRYARYGKHPSPEKVDTKQRFSFTERKLNITDQLMNALELLKVASSQLYPELAPPVPENSSGLLEEVKKDITPFWSYFEDWSRQMWNHLQVCAPLAGQAFTCGGDLADTYWYAQRAGAEKLADMLSYYRLNYISERLNDFSTYLPAQAVLAIQHSLACWSIGEQVKGMDFDRQKRMLVRLESQAKVWRDLLFGLRQSNSYLTARDRQQIAWGALTASTGLVILISLSVWMAVLALASLGHGVIGYTLNLKLDTNQINEKLPGYLSNWQNWSALLATISSVIAVLSGVVKGLSGWLWALQQGIYKSLTQRRINCRTYRSMKFQQKENSDDQN